MNWRRLRSSMGSSSEPAVPAYLRLRMPRKRPQVLGVDLNRSESSRWATRRGAHRRSRNGCYGTLDRVIASVRLDAGGPDDLGPLLSFLGDQLAEVGGRAWKCNSTQLGAALISLLSFSTISVGVALGTASRLEARQKFAHLRSRLIGSRRVLMTPSFLLVCSKLPQQFCGTIGWGTVPCEMVHTLV
jgi:hypothetical protein